MGGSAEWGPFLDLVSQTPRPRGGGRPLFADYMGGWREEILPIQGIHTTFVPLFPVPPVLSMSCGGR